MFELMSSYRKEVLALSYLYPCWFFCCLWVFSFLLIPTAFASTSLDALTKQANEEKLAYHPQWLALGYYSEQTFSKKIDKSEMDDKRFFLAPMGTEDSEAELLATLKGMFIVPSENMNDHVRCRFPARTHWLQSMLSIPSSDLPEVVCNDFSQWKNAIGAESISIIFPAAYLDSPSSMFGHTFIRLDKPQSVDSSGLLSYTVSYAAQKKEDDSELGFVLRGLIGGYPGETSVLPYYLKSKEYSDIESRDIWEYQLNFTQEETEQFIRHLWEIQDLNFNYFFFTQNCAYRALAMLRVIRPDVELPQKYDLYTIPVDTLRHVLDVGWVQNVKYRPSVISRFKHTLQQFDDAQQKVIKQLVDNTDTEPQLYQTLSPFKTDEKAKLLEAAYAYSRLVSGPQEAASNASFNLLKAQHQLKKTA